MTSKTIDHLIADSKIAVSKFQRVRDWSAAAYWEGRLDSLEQAKACRLTDAESAVIEAALAMVSGHNSQLAMALLGERNPRLARALASLRTERRQPPVDSVSAGGCLPRPVERLPLPECDDCGGMHHTDSVYCPMRQQDDCDD